MINKLNVLIKKLASAQTGATLFNPYNQICKSYDLSTAPGLRQYNLRLYIEAYIRNPANSVWFFSNADQHGTKKTGVPLLNTNNFSKVEKLLENTVQFEQTHKGSSKDYDPSLHNRIWDMVSLQNPKPLLWPLLPFFPHHKDSELKYREPRMSEFETNSEYIQIILDMFKPKNIIATDTKTKEILDMLKIKSKFNDLNL